MKSVLGSDEATKVACAGASTGDADAAGGCGARRRIARDARPVLARPTSRAHVPNDNLSSTISTQNATPLHNIP